MQPIKPGDIVARRSYNCDILFKVKEIKETERSKLVALLKGLDVRLLADAPLEDLEVKRGIEVLEYRHQNLLCTKQCLRQVYLRRAAEQERLARRLQPVEQEEESFTVPGRVLHVDGDEEYCQKCRQTYAQLEIPATVCHVPEEEQAAKVSELLEQYRPDILVLTGHDGVLKEHNDLTALDSYRSSGYFVQAVRRARGIQPYRDSLIIFAGACQSHYEALLEAGANFASSPKRVLIHAYDPLFVAERVAFTPVSRLVPLLEVVKNTITGPAGIGGVDTRGCLRLGYPKSTPESVAALSTR